jgi:hypothetical protein
VSSPPPGPPDPDPQHRPPDQPPPGYPPQNYPPPGHPPSGYPPPGYPPPGPGQAPSSYGDAIAPVAPGRRFSGGMVWAGIGLDLVYMVVAGLLTAVASNLLDSGPTAGGLAIVTGVLSFLPLIGGIVLAVVGRTPRVRGLGLGFAIGWAVWLIVAAGACVALIAFFYSSSGGFGP